MAPIIDELADALSKRYLSCPYGYYYSNGGCVRGSNFYFYGRWILAAIVIAFFLFIFFLYLCVKSRRNRRNGTRPMYGTGWMAPQPVYHHNNPQGYNPPPAYGAPADSYPMNQYPQDGGMYRGQDSGVEPPKHTYHGDYAPPAGPPPGK